MTRTRLLTRNKKEKVKKKKKEKEKKFATIYTNIVLISEIYLFR